ncbi:Eka-Go1 protein-like protein [Leptotrombidium deliense]|uniref:Eka-Go1 protein-like protein n=1 Tax=Leptotrombidium deliense TaxID=299467 RepID=A0A443SL16_9ACAR|nr:Eka-Go1 protein-like protein [Leptotrombidium deliense]
MSLQMFAVVAILQKPCLLLTAIFVYIIGLSALQCISGQEIRVKSRSSKKRSLEIDRQLNEMARQEKQVIKILLLGAEESGKSTLVKQMKIIHNDGFTKEELLSFMPTVRHNLLASMKYVLLGMSILKIKIHPQNKVRYFLSVY